MDKDIKKLVIARISFMPENLKLSIGSFGMFDKYEIIDNVEKENEIGKKIVEIQLNFLKSFKRKVE